MDPFGCYRPLPEDFQELRERLEKNGSIVFPYSADNFTAFILFMSTRFVKMGIMPFGGDPDGRVYLGVWGLGCNHFGKHKIYPSYFEEKLSLNKSDAEALSKLWNGMFGDKDD